MLMSAKSAPALGDYLPYLASRTIDTTHGRWGFLILKDGTLCTAFEIGGRDVYCSDDAVLEQIAGSIYSALSTLPPRSYIQAVYQTGLPFADVIADFASFNCDEAPALVSRARKHRLAFLRRDKSLSKVRIVYYLGIRGALACQFQRPQSIFWSKIKGKRHPQELRALHVRHAAEQVANAATQFMGALSGASIESWPLSEYQLVHECHAALNPLSAKALPAPFVLELREDLKHIKAGQRAIFRGPSLSAQLPLGSVDVEPSFLSIENGETRLRSLFVQSYPGQLFADSLFPIQSNHLPDTPMRLVITHRATDRAIKKEKLESRRNVVRSLAETSDADAKAAFDNYENLLNTLASTDARIFDTSVAAVVTGSSLHALDEATREIQQGFAQINFALTERRNQQLQAWLATLPAAGYRARNPYPLHTTNCAYLMPYARPDESEHEPADFVFMTRHRSLARLSWRQTGRQDHRNTFVIGSIGSGKTFLVSHLIKTILALGGHVIITDVKGPQNSTYLPLTKLLGGQYTALDAADNDVAFNPCPEHRFMIREGKWTDALETLTAIVCMMAVPGIDDHEDKDFYTRIATDSIRATYKATQDPERTPILSDIAKALANYEGPTPRFDAMAEDMAMRLRLWCEDRNRGALLNRPTTVDSDNPFQVFDFKNLQGDPALASVLLATLSARITDKMQLTPPSVPKMFAFDEAWSFFEHSQTAADLIGQKSRVVRSYGAFIVVLAHSHTDVSDSIAGAALMATTSIYVLNQANSRHEEAAKVFDLTPRQLDLYRTLEVRKGEFAEFLLVNKNSQQASLLRYAPTPWEMWVDTARAIDLELKNVVMRRFSDALSAFDYLAKEYPHGATEEGLEHEKRLARETA